jgi:hypothetical protein
MSLKIRIALLLLAIFIIIATVISNCSGGGGGGILPGPPGGGGGGGGDDVPDGVFDMADNAKNVDDMPATLDIIDGDTFTFSYTGTPPNIKTGDIIYGSAQGGYLREVTNVADTGTKLIISTIQASLDEAFNDANLSSVTHLTDRLSSARNSFCTGSGVAFNLSGSQIYSDDQVTVLIYDGMVTFSPDIQTCFKFDDQNGATYFKSVINGQMIYDFDMKILGTGDFDLTKEALVFSTDPVDFFIGPIFTTARINFYAGVDFDGTVKDYLISGINTSYTASAGAEYQNGNWTPIIDQSHEFNEGTIAGAVDGPVTFKGYIRPEITLSFFGMQAPGVVCDSSFDLTGTGQLNPDCLIYDLAGGIKFDILVDPEIVGAISPYVYEFDGINEPVSSGQVGDCNSACENLLVNAIVGMSEIEGGGEIEFSVSAAGDSGITYSWTCDPPEKGYFDTPNDSHSVFHAIEVDTVREVEIKVLVKSDNCLTGIQKVKTVSIQPDSCYYSVTGILGQPSLLEMHSEIYSVMVSAYSVPGITFNWTCDPTTAGYFTDPHLRIVEFNANAVNDNTDVSLQVEVDSDECDPVDREKHVTVEDSQAGTS